MKPNLESSNNTQAIITASNYIGGGFLALLLALCAIVPQRIPNAAEVALQTIVAAVLFGAGIWAANMLRQRAISLDRSETTTDRALVASTIVQSAAILGLFAYLFGAMEPFQHIIVAGWMDDSMLHAERAIVGFNISIASQQLLSRPLTEWMMFSYMIYVPLLPAMAWLCYRGGGERATQEYLFAIAATYSICYLGFIVYPLASPMFHDRASYPAPFVGWFFTWTSDILRTHSHYAGGSLPSPHCAAGTLMLVMLYRYQRKIFYVALPVILSLYVSTVYGRFHYVEDGIMGIAAALAVLKLAPAIVAAFDRLHQSPVSTLKFLSTNIR